MLHLFKRFITTGRNFHLKVRQQICCFDAQNKLKSHFLIFNKLKFLFRKITRCKVFFFRLISSWDWWYSKKLSKIPIWRSFLSAWYTCSHTFHESWRSFFRSYKALFLMCKFCQTTVDDTKSKIITIKGTKSLRAFWNLDSHF